MSERDRYPAGVPCWVDTLQPDPDAAVGFYGELFGWQFKGPGPMSGGAGGKFFVARVGDRDVAGVGSAPPGGPPRPAWTTYIRVESADAAATRARELGGAVIAEPFDAAPAGRVAMLADPGGAVFGVWEAIEREGAQVVNAPGAWSMSMLNTADPEGARAFYNGLFGWEAEGFSIGEDQAFLWRLPGYFGGEPEQPVPRDVVAVMAPTADGAPAHWSVDFWVADVDATAARAGELGGEVVVAPFDMPIGREAVLADPRGAAFTVTRVGVGG